MANPPVSRASLLAGLRTGGPRSSSGPVPHTALPGVSFDISPVSRLSQPVYPEEDDDQVVQIPRNFNLYANDHHGGSRTLPMTAAVDNPANRFASQQRSGPMPTTPFTPSFAPSNLNPVQAQAFQMQIMQLELMKIQAQNFQAEVLAQAARHALSPAASPAQPQFPPHLRPSYNPPATAGPASSNFDLRSATLSAQMRKASAPEQLKAQADNSVPMTAALGGRFGSRSVSAGSFPPDTPPSTLGSTTVISGGTSLGSPAPNQTTFNNASPSKSDSVSSWRRGGPGLSLNGSLRSSPSVKITPPPADSPLSSAAMSTPSTANTVTPTGNAKFRPQPLRFSAAVSQPMPAVVAVDSDTTEVEEDSSSTTSSKSNASPTTPPSESSLQMPLSPREEASRKLYEGLGIGRPVSSNSNRGGDAVIKPTVIVSEPGSLPVFSLSNAYPLAQKFSQPLRQPRGPPSGMEELAPQNFATRIKNQALEGLGMLRPTIVEAY